MWPSKNHVGPQLTYGVNGSPVIVSDPKNPSTSQKPGLQYPRLCEENCKYYQIENSLMEFSADSTDMTSKLRRWKAAGSANHYEEYAVSGNLLKAITSEAGQLHEHNAYDPSKGPLSFTFTLGTGAYSDAIVLGGRCYYPRAKTNIIAIQCHAFTSDPYTLRLVPMMPKSRNFIDKKQRETRKHIFNNPDLSRSLADCSFPFEIHQIDFCQSRKVLVVRGLVQVAFLSVRWQNNPGMKGILLTKLFTITWTPANLAHVAIAPGKFVLADRERNYAVYTYSLQKQWRYEKICSGVLPKNAVSDKSDWKRLCWAPSSESFLYFTRKGVTRVNVKTSVAQKLITFHIWSRALDYAVFGDFLFLLTSQELIWTRVAPDGALTRLLSWKHYLDNRDVTLKLAACYCELTNVYLCLLYSEEAPASLMLTFGMRNGFPCSIRDPYLFPKHIKYPQFVSLFESPSIIDGPGSILNLVEMSKTYRSVISRYNDSPDRAFRSPKVPFVDPSPVLEPVPSQLTVMELKELYDLFARETSRSYNYLSDLPSENEKQNVGVDSSSESSSSSASDSSDSSDTSSDESETSPEIKSEAIQSDEKNSDLVSRQPAENVHKNITNEPSQAIFENTTKPPNDESPDDDTARKHQRDLVQEYAFKLGTDIRSVFDNDFTTASQGLTNQFPYHSLASIAETVPLDVTDIGEFESMLTQLRNHYESQEVILNPLDFRILEQIDPAFAQAHGSITNIPKALNKFSRDCRSEAAIILITSLIRAHREFRHDYIDAIRRESEDLPEKFCSLVDDWDLPDSTHSRDTRDIPVSTKPLSTRPLSHPNGTTKKMPLLQRAITQNSQHYADSQSLFESQTTSRNYESQRTDSRGSQDWSQESQNGSAAYPNPPSSPPLVSVDPDFQLFEPLESPSKADKKKVSKSIQSQSQGPSASRSASQPASQPTSQAASQAASLRTSQRFSQSVKRPGTQPVARKKKKAKGGFA